MHAYVYMYQCMHIASYVIMIWPLIGMHTYNYYINGQVIQLYIATYYI